MIVFFIGSFNNCYGEKWFLDVISLPRHFITGWKVFKLIRKVEVDVWSGKWTHFRVRVHRITIFYLFEFFNKFVFEFFIMFFDDNKPFWGEANLSCVSASSLNSCVDSSFQIRIKKNKKRIISSQLHDRSFQILSCCWCYHWTRSWRSSEAYPTNTIVRHYFIYLVMRSKHVLILSRVKANLVHKFLNCQTKKRSWIGISGQETVSQQ